MCDQYAKVGRVTGYKSKDCQKAYILGCDAEGDLIYNYPEWQDVISMAFYNLQNEVWAMIEWAQERVEQG
jgi:hypothetical protein